VIGAVCRRRFGALVLVATMLATLVVANPAVVEAQPNEDGSYGYRAQRYSSAAERVTGEKPESKLWFHAGRWWATMIPEDGASHTIHELDGTTWRDTGVVVDVSADARGDALLVGDQLYISNRNTSRLFRATWNGSTWVPRGAPSTLPVPNGTPALTIARDSAGRLWITWLNEDRVHVARAADTAQLEVTDWTVIDLSTRLADGSKALVSDDDISAVISFQDDAGPAVGVMWSNQNDRVTYFGVHRDSAADGTWTIETIGQGITREADDHVNLKTSNGLVYAAVKTEHSTNSPDPSLIRLLVRSRSGTWAIHEVSAIDERDTRPIAALEISGGAVYVFMTRNPADDQRQIVYKRARLVDVAPGARIEDPFGPAITFLRSDTTLGIDDPTTMKANATSTSGIVVLASTSSHYWWNRLDIDAPPPPMYTVSTSVVGQGTVTLDPPSGPYVVGTVVTATATPADGWQFDGWSGDLSGTANPASLVVEGPRQVTATFKELPPDPDPVPDPPAEPTTSLLTTYRTTSGWAAHLAADLTGDGHDELLSYHPSNGSWWVSSVDADGNASSPRRFTTYRTRTGWDAHLAADVTGDGRAELLSYHPSNGTWWVTSVDGDGTASSPRRFTAYRTTDGWSAHLAADVDGDGRAELLSFHPSNGTWWRTSVAEDGAVQAPTLFTTYRTRTGWSAHAAADVDGDGRAALLSFHPSNGTWWRTSVAEDGVVQAPTLFTTYRTRLGWTAHVTGDADADGRAELFSFHPSNGTWWRTAVGGDGAVGDPQRYTTYRTRDGWQTHLGGDVTGGGRADLLSYHPSNGTWWRTAAPPPG
jgi:hypothetical protein